jgi:HEAT repeat protein
MSARNADCVSRFTILSLGFILCLGSGVAVATAAQSQFVNANTETRSAAQGLEAAVQQVASQWQQPVWLAYQVDSIGGNRSVCCDYHDDGDQNGSCGKCNLEKQHGDSVIKQNQNATVKLEQPSQVSVLLRMDQKRVMRIRLVSANCILDAGGLRVVWLTDVKPAESVALLTRYVREDSHERDGDGLAEQVVMAIAQHADPSADRALANFVAPDQPSWLREKTSFWLGAARGRSGVKLLEKMAASDPNGDVRAKVAFALYVSHEPEAVDDMLRMAKGDPEPHVRGQALFWLAQKAGQKASNAITAAIQNDPDTEVKKKAVFALSQMPKDEGVPKLIEVAQNNHNPEVRKQAMFWLGQSNDPRALAFFEKILSQ